MSVNVDKIVEQYLTVRDALEEAEARYKEQIRDLVGIKELLVAQLLDFLAQTKQESARTASGTVTQHVRYTATLNDPEAFMKHVIDTHQFDLLERRASSTAVREYIAKHNAKPPGCDLTSWRSVSVRVPTAKPSDAA